MMSRLLTLLLLAPIAILLVVFCVVNREPVTLSMDALGTSPQLAFAAPLFVLLLGFLIAGLLLGSFATYVTQARYRARASHREEEAARLRNEVEREKANVRRMREEEERRRAATALPVGASASSPALGSTQPAPMVGIAGPRAA